MTVYTRKWGSVKYIMCDASSNKTSSKNVYTETIRRKSAHTLNYVWLKKKKEAAPKSLTPVLFHFYAYTSTFSNQVRAFRKKSREKYARRRIEIILGL